MVQQLVVFLRALITPRSKDKDLARREGILNVLLVSCLGLVLFAAAVACINELNGVAQSGATQAVAAMGLFLGLAYGLSRRGHARIVAYGLIFLLFGVTTYGIYQWGADLPQALLTYALIVVMAGILIDSQCSFLMTLLIGVSLLIVTFLDLFVFHSAIPKWRNTDLTMGDSIVATVTLMIITVVSWLFNREMEQALKRDRLSELALKRQRDDLELEVEQRTLELRQAQAEKIIQLYRLAEFGKTTSGLFHDLANPLTLISLNLDILAKQIKEPEILQARTALERVMMGTKRLEDLVRMVRKQLQSQEVVKMFSLNQEILDAIQILAHKAKSQYVKLEFIANGQIFSSGDVVKFGQLLTNLITNAIDAYDGLAGKDKLVKISLKKIGGLVQLKIQDWGCGIDEENLSKIFNPLFTTKGAEKGTGIGLAISKDIIKKDFLGTYSVKSKKGFGTTFIIEFPLRTTL